ncbi:MAG TPA: tetratricopeptide repeat protein [Candidatus Sulfotelmatobacter sp.]|jgi:tetratricopeptide (TPR) repeat protein|nr:tetratricopeptide repeat protein [Candidatus Sulfotelmatobacter sp.]
MTRNFLAIPAVTFLAVALSPQLCSQERLVQVANTSISTAAQTPAVSGLADEEMARLHMARKEYKEAEDIFYRLAVSNPKNPLYWNELGIAHHNQAQLELAIRCYQKAAKVDPHYADAQNNIGTVLYERKKFPKAIRAYKRAITLRGDFAPFYLNLGYAYFKQKDFENSIASFRKALQLDPASLDPARSRIGTVIQDRSVSVDRGRFYFLLAKSFAQGGDIERAILYLRKAKDEGYSEFNSVQKDPTFALVLKDPAAEDLLVPKPVEAAQP